MLQVSKEKLFDDPRICHGNRIYLSAHLQVSWSADSTYTTVWLGLFELQPLTILHEAQTQAKPSEKNVSGHTNELCRKWLTTCSRSHERCNASLVSLIRRPKRLLHIARSSSDLHLSLSTDHVSVSYVTLSYCWGSDSSVLKLKESNLSKFKNMIPVEETPRTILDAAEIAYNLGFTYMWVDSLCIIQDLKQDWQEQSVLMGSIYAGGAINIAATGAEKATDALIYHRDPCVVLPTTVYIDVGGVPRGKYAIYDFQSWSREINERRINTRGWVFQERLMSPRTIHVSQDQVLWECRDLCACETFPDGLPGHPTWNDANNTPTNFSKSSLIPELSVLLFQLGTSGPLGEAKRIQLAGKSKCSTPELQVPCANNELENRADCADAYLKWRHLITIYSSCSFTETSDKLVALIGLANQVQAFHVDEYDAGMWRTTLPRDLLWHLAKEPRTRLPYEPVGPSYFAPTWSWASVNDQIEFPKVVVGDHYPARINRIYRGKDSSDRPDPAVIYLRLWSLMFLARIRPTLSADPQQLSLDDEAGASDHNSGMFLPDRGYLAAGTMVLCLVLQLSPFSQDTCSIPHFHGIVLLPAGDCNDHFVRIGYFVWRLAQEVCSEVFREQEIWLC